MPLHKYTLLAMLAVPAMVGCSDDQQTEAEPIVTGVYDKSVDFSSYESFTLIEADDNPAGEGPQDLLSEGDRVALNQAIVHEMEARGYVRDDDSPDLRLTTFVRIDDVDVTVQGSYWYDYYYGWYWGYSYPWYYQDVTTLAAGSLIIDAVAVGELDDDRDDMLVFRGTASALLLDDGRPDVTDEIPGVVAEIFEFWPEPAAQ